MNIEANLDNSFDDDVELTSDTDQGGIIVPKQTCEHVQSVHLLSKIKHLDHNQCLDCESTNENWLCLSCGEYHCSRYINNHGEEHWLFTLLTDEQSNIGHCLTLNSQDLSVWCYPCKSYINNVRLHPILRELEILKFGESETVEDEVSLSSDNQSAKLTEMKKVGNPSTIIAVQDHAVLEELKKTDLLSYCYSIKVRSASIDELVCLHSSDYVNKIVSAEKNPGSVSDSRFQIRNNETAFSDARLSAGLTIDVIENVLKNHINGLILLTSPGHRALRDHGNGASIYNNIALAVNSVLIDKPCNSRKTSLALIDSNNHVHMEGATPIEDAICHMIHVLSPTLSSEQRKSSQIPTTAEKDNSIATKIRVERVLVLDITKDHGCGLQSIYYESDQVLYVSIHAETHQHRSSYHECGEERGLGYTMNIPLSAIDTVNDRDYVTIMNELILPLAKEFQPELIVVCLDFQIEKLTDLGYAWIIEQLSAISDSKLIVALDGDLADVSSKIAYVQTILSLLIGKLIVPDNEQWDNNNDMNLDIRQKVDHIKEKHKQYWSCFR